MILGSFDCMAAILSNAPKVKTTPKFCTALQKRVAIKVCHMYSEGKFEAGYTVMKFLS
jgi:hypothetical protein